MLPTPARNTVPVAASRIATAGLDCAMLTLRAPQEEPLQQNSQEGEYQWLYEKS